MKLQIDERPTHFDVTGRGFFSIEEAKAHFGELSTAVARWRRAGKPIKVMVDLRDSAPQSPDVADYIAVATNRLYRDEDRVAIIVTSSVLRMQLKRIHAGQSFGIFLSEEPAQAFVA